ncbi:hypothetical protein Bbelb_106190 [Branchiostoma belcheri]|nr:hypothetical protein Bbelb_106190 [Branchiostoma belcheri]
MLIDLKARERDQARVSVKTVQRHSPTSQRPRYACMEARLPQSYRERRGVDKECDGQLCVQRARFSGKYKYGWCYTVLNVGNVAYLWRRHRSLTTNMATPSSKTERS